MPNQMRPRRSPVRYLAPLALLATIAGTYLVIDNALEGKRAGGSARRHGHATEQVTGRSGTATGSGDTTTGRTTTGATPPGNTVPGKAGAPRYYVVRSGDSLYAISQRVHVALATIVALNPGVSPTSLHIGQRLTIRR